MPTREYAAFAPRPTTTLTQLTAVVTSLAERQFASPTVEQAALGDADARLWLRCCSVVSGGLGVRRRA